MMYLYDLVITHALHWPSLTCQWFQDKESCVFLRSNFLPLSRTALQPSKQTLHRPQIASRHAHVYPQIATAQSLSHTPTRSCISRGHHTTHVASVFASASSEGRVNIWDFALNTAPPKYAHPGKAFKRLPLSAAMEDAVVVTIEEQKKLGVLVRLILDPINVLNRENTHPSASTSGTGRKRHADAPQLIENCHRLIQRHETRTLEGLVHAILTL